VFWIEGGPGGSAIDDVAWWQDSTLRSARDLVYVDLRGTGRSNPLNCDLFDRNGQGLERFLGPDMFPEAGVQRCNGALAKVANLEFYTTSNMMDDLDDVRVALGYDRINIVGLSAGTRSAMDYLRRHSAHVRSLVLNGVAPLYDYATTGFARYAQNALEGLARECAADHDCHRRFPDVLGDTAKALAAAEFGYAKADVPDPSTGEPVQVTLNRDILGEVIRNRLYTPGDASDLPVLLHMAALGNYQPMAEIALSLRRGAAQGNGDGVYFSAICAEDMPWIDVQKEEKEASGTFLGAARVRQQAAACSVWPIKAVSADFGRRFSSDVPVLIISGQLDPVTPASNGEGIARELPNSLHVIVPSGGHCVGDGLTGFDCINRLQEEFIARGSPKGLDTSCVKSIHRQAFSMKVTSSKVTKLEGSVAKPSVGTYIDSAGGGGAEVKLNDGLLKIVFDDGETLVLFPLSERKFRIWGAPTRSVFFRVRHGRVTSFRLEQGGKRQVELARASG
jgi:pimeloyl-ACP methyl ester carboxylesterase